jgi:hypothetical protein
VPLVSGSSPLERQHTGGHTDRDPGQRAVVLRRPQLRGPALGLGVEAAVGTEVLAGGPVGRLPEVGGLIGVAGLVGLLCLEPGAGEVPVEQARRDRVRGEGSDGGAPDPVLPAARAASSDW